MSPSEEDFEGKKIYPISVSEAKKRLEILRPYLKQMRTVAENFLVVETELIKLSQSEDIGTMMKKRYELDQIEGEMAEIQDLFVKQDCVIKDMREGLIDFVAIRNGKPVWLCFKEGEAELLYFHGWNAGFVGRQPIDFE